MAKRKTHLVALVERVDRKYRPVSVAVCGQPIGLSEKYDTRGHAVDCARCKQSRRFAPVLSANLAAIAHERPQ